MSIMKPCEATEQELFLKYMELRGKMVYANLNENIWSGIIRYWVRPESKAIKMIASIERKMKKLGKKKGIPDLFIPIMSGKYGGMYIEMKYGKNKATKEQMVWLKDLTKQGYYCVICYSAKQAISAFEKYEKG